MNYLKRAFVKTAAIILTLVLSVGILTACKEKAGEESSSDTNNVSETAQSFDSPYLDDGNMSGFTEAAPKDVEIWRDKQPLAYDGNWIFYNSPDDNKLYRISPEGKNKRLVIDESYNYITLTGDRIYYTGNQENFTNFNLYKIKIDSTGIEKISNTKVCNSLLDKRGNVAVSDGWIYYSNLDDERKIYRIKIDGTGNQKISNDIANDVIAISDGWIYYCTSIGEMYKMQLGGKDKQKICDKITPAPTLIKIIGDKIYFWHNGFPSGSFYSINTDGSDFKKILSGFSIADIANDWIYFSIDNSAVQISRLSDGIYRMKLDGSERQIISKEERPGALFALAAGNKTYLYWPGTDSEQ